MRGVAISPCEQGFHPSHSRALRLYERCEAAGLPLIVHQGEDFVAASMLEHAQPLMLDAVARDFPKLRILLTHCGHPFTDQALTLIGKHPHVYTEISGLTARPRQLYHVLMLAHQLDVTDKLLLGSDFPRQTPRHAIAAVYSMSQLAQGAHTPTVPREKLRGIVERDALAALGIKRTASAGRESPAKAQESEQDRRLQIAN
jgi:predicted TIM-barrel fold metal-dependent hydrolase